MRTARQPAAPSKRLNVMLVATLLAASVGCTSASSARGTLDSEPATTAAGQPEAGDVGVDGSELDDPVGGDGEPETADAPGGTTERGERVVEVDPGAPPEQPPAPTQEGNGGDPMVFAADVPSLALDWDKRNRAIYEADPSAFLRVAAEAEQFAIVGGGSGADHFAALLTDTAVLGGELGPGGVSGLVAIGDFDIDRDRVVLLTTVDFVTTSSQDAARLTEALTAVHEQSPGTVQSLTLSKTTVSLVRLDSGGAVAIGAVSASGPNSEQVAQGLIAAVRGLLNEQ